MSDPHYLYRVLGLSALPRLLTFGLTLVSLPLLLRGMGAAEYGLMVYLNSVLAILELAAGLGICAAAGKALAECRAHRVALLKRELLRWLRLQMVVCAISLGPVVASGWLFLRLTGGPEVPAGLFLIAAANLYLSLFIAFVRTALSSLLAFRRVALLDAAESTLRSAGWIWVGVFQPTVWALAWVGLAGATATLALGALLLHPQLSAQLRAHEAGGPEDVGPRLVTLRPMLRESIDFFVLTAGTRAFGSLPVLLIGRLVGVEAAGVLGAFAKAVEILSLPFTVIGNALMVRAPEIKRAGQRVLRAYWDLLCRLCVLAIVVSAAAQLMHGDGAALLLPGSQMARELFFLCPLLLLARSVSDLFAPATDYVGGLRPRIVILWFCALLQLPLIWWGARQAGALGAVGAMVGAYVVMVAGYVLIARRVFFAGAPYRPPAEALLGGALAALLAAAALSSPGPAWLRLGGFLFAVIAGFAAVPTLRHGFMPQRLIRFDFTT